MQLVVGSSSIKFNQDLTSPSHPQVMSPLLQSQMHSSIITFHDKFCIYTKVIYVMPFTFRRNNSRHRCDLLDEHIAWVSLSMACLWVTTKIHVISYQRCLYFSSTYKYFRIPVSLLTYKIRNKYTNRSYKKLTRRSFTFHLFILVL